jgi:hypothetical protein
MKTFNTTIIALAIAAAAASSAFASGLNAADQQYVNGVNGTDTYAGGSPADVAAEPVGPSTYHHHYRHHLTAAERQDIQHQDQREQN